MPKGTYYMVHRDENGKQTNESVEWDICYSVSDFVKDCVEFGWDASEEIQGMLYMYRSNSLPSNLLKQAL
jgi:hypothetical protein